MTPEQVARERALADAVRGRGVDMSPVGHWTQGAARMVEALGGVLHERRAGAADEEGRAGARATIAADPVLSALLGGSGADGAQPVSGAVMARSAPGGDWLRYSNQRAVRNQPINDDLVQALSFLPEMGVSMEVISGGQPSHGQNRVGSHRHDDGGAADVRFYRDGRALDWRNPDDIPVLQDIVRGARARGVTGFGAGEGYMSPGMMHIGFGAPAVWGAGGSGANAPDWLREAFGSTQTAGGGAASVPTGPSPSLVAALMAAQADPWVQEQYGPAIEALLGQQMQMQNTAYQSQLAQEDPLYQAQLERALLENEQMRNPAPAAPNLAYHGDRVIDMNTGEVVQDYSQPQGFSLISPEEAVQMGLPDGTYQAGPDGRVYEVGGGGVTQNVNLGDNNADPLWGTPDSGFVWARDEAGNVITELDENGYMRPRQLPIAGGAADVERQATAAADQAAAERSQLAQENAAQYAATVTRDLGTALEHLDTLSPALAGEGLIAASARESSASIPGTAMWNMSKFVDSALSNLTLDTMNRMRESSPSGATGFGNMSERQMAVIQGVMGNWSPGLPIEDQRMIINQLSNFYRDVQFGTEAERQMAVASGAMTPEENAAIQATYLPVVRDSSGLRVDEATAPAASSGIGSPGDGGAPTGNVPATSDPALSPPAATAMPPDAMPAPDASSNRFASMPAQDLLSIDLDALTPAELAQWDAAMDALGF